MSQFDHRTIDRTEIERWRERNKGELDPKIDKDPRGAFHSTKIFEISGPKLNETVKIPGKVFENLGIRFE